MKSSDLAYLKKWFAEYCRSFYSEEEEHQGNILLKEYHTYKVCSNIVRISKEISLNENRILLAETIALFHDVGRFRQYSEYRTFRDSDSVNHGMLGAEIIVEEKILEALTAEERDIIIRSVRFHNAFSIPDIDSPEIILFLKLIRDADKLDIWRVFFEYFGKSASERSSSVALGFPDVPEYSEDVLSCIFEKRLVALSMIKTLNDFRLTLLSWVFDLNFKASLNMVIENDYVNRIAETLPKNNEIRDAVILLNEFVHHKNGGADV